ncbi:P-loop containing nucleoside triphosphate hydrolase protein [Xylariomycetidae sp. FL2044]|nr:P-loop containing nucleoside triphosphate hydrolase protein [Xylariomycetidae sp. FL2044]
MNLFGVLCVMSRYVRVLLSWEPMKLLNYDGTRPITVPPPPLPDREETLTAGDFRFLILGPKGCGKTALITRLTHNAFNFAANPAPNAAPHRYPRIEIDSHTHLVSTLELQIPEDPSSLLSSSSSSSSSPSLVPALKITEGALLLYDVTSRASLLALKPIAEALRGSPAATVPVPVPVPRGYAVVLAGAKADGVVQVPGGGRQVTWREGCEFARTLGFRTRFVEVSARTGDGVAEAFDMLAREVLKGRWVEAHRREREDERRCRASSQLMLVVQPPPPPGEEGEEEEEKKKKGGEELGATSREGEKRGRWRVWTGPWFRGRKRVLRAEGRKNLLE